MASNCLVEPDLEFIKQIQENGGESLKKCFQCATCSVACKLSPDKNPFPRKEMIWAQWGQKDRLMADHHIWVCHQCNDCSTLCPRGARPGDVLAALRELAVQHYAVPGVLSKMLRNPLGALIGLVIAAAFVVFMLAVDDHLSVLTSAPNGEAHFGKHFLSHLTLNVAFTSAFTFFILLGVVGLMRFIADMKKNEPIPSGAPGFIGAVIGAGIDVLLHRKFGRCDAASGRKVSHFGILWGFLILLVVTAIVVLLVVVAPESYPINSLTNPLKIAGNLGAALLIGGSLIAIYDRLTDPDKAGKSGFFDWFFLLVVFAVGVTGVLTEVARFASLGAGADQNFGWAYWMYFIHLTFVFSLLCYLPYSKFAHLLYRFFAMVHAKRVGGYPD